MKKYLVIVLLFFLVNYVWSVQPVKVARIKYNWGGDCQSLRGGI